MKARHLWPGLSIAAALVAAPARGAPIAEVGPWVQAFTEAALANDPAAMLARAKEVIDPRFPADGLPGIFGKIDAVVGTLPGDHAEQFDEANVGTIMKRVNIAIHYPKTYLFYSLSFVRDGSGWQLVELDYNTNVNEVFKLTWPH